MTPDAEARFINLWEEGSSYREIAQALGCALGTVASRAASLVAQGKIAPRRRRKARPEDPPADRPQSTVYPKPSTVDPPPSTVDHPREDLQAILTIALQPVLARLEALETGLAQQRPADRPPSTVHPDIVDGPPSNRPPSTLTPGS